MIGFLDMDFFSSSSSFYLIDVYRLWIFWYFLVGVEFSFLVAGVVWSFGDVLQNKLSEPRTHHARFCVCQVSSNTKLFTTHTTTTTPLVG